MKKRLLAYISVTSLLVSCASSTVRDDNSSVKADMSRVSQALYYGADISQFPPKVRKWIVEEGFPKAMMEKPWMRDSQLKAAWSKDGNAVIFEASYITADGYDNAGKRQVWASDAKYEGGDISSYGKYKKYRTLRARYNHKLKTERLLKEDPSYSEVINFAKKMSNEMEYDWAAYSGYRGASPRKTPGKKYAVCDGYSNEVMDKVLALKSVAAVEEWASPGHSWNVLVLNDGRRLYADITWFDNEHINTETGAIYKTEDYGWENITFDPEVFKYANISYDGSFSHAKGVLEKVLRK